MGSTGAMLWLTLAGAVTVWVRRHDPGPCVTRSALGAAAYFVLNAAVLASGRLVFGADSTFKPPSLPKPARAAS